MTKILTLMGLASLLVACGGGTSQPPATAATPAADTAAPASNADAAAASAAPATFDEQVSMGQTLYAQNCAGCHGASGEGGKAPKVVGLKEGALPLDPPPGAEYRKTQFKTVADVAKFTVAAMPPNKAGTLTEEQYLAVLAFALKANGIDLPNKLDMASAETLTIPR